VAKPWGKFYPTKITIYQVEINIYQSEIEEYIKVRD